MSDTFSPFSIARLPHIEFGSGTLEKLPAIAAGYGRHLLLVTGRRSFSESEAGARLLAQLQQRGVSWEQVRVSGEPSWGFVDGTVAALRATRFDAVVGVGGGSALDAAKAIAGLLRPGNSVLDHLERVGPELPYCRPATRLIAEWAIVDPDLLATCPPALIAANGCGARRFLVDTLRRWEDELALPPLALYGIGEGDLPRIVAASRGSSMTTHPLVLSDRELTQILASRL